MPVTDYNSLVAAVQQIAEDDGTEFANYIPTAIDTCEVVLTRMIDTLGVINTATVNTTNGIATVTKPGGYKNGQDLSYTSPSTGKRVIVKKKTYSYILDYWPTQSTTGEPKYYADVDNTTFILAPTPNNTIGMTLRYEGRPPALTIGNTTNYFTQFCSDALLFGTMVEMFKFARNEPMQSEYEKHFGNAVQTLLNEARRARRDNSGRPANKTLNTQMGDS